MQIFSRYLAFFAFFLLHFPAGVLYWTQYFFLQGLSPAILNFPKGVLL